MSRERSSAALVGLILLHSASAGAREPSPGEPSPGEPSPGEPSPGEPSSPATDPVTDEPPPPRRGPSPYSLPWQLRPAAAVNVVRSDTSAAFHEMGATLVSFVTVSARLASSVAIAARYGLVHDVARAGGARSAFTNLALSATYVTEWSGPFRVALSGGAIIPSAQGGGDEPNPREKKAIGAGGLARSAMDTSMFAPNDLGLFGGAAIVYLAEGFTVQLEGTISELVRVKGAALQKESSKTSSTWGAHVGVFVVPALSIGAELRYQIFIDAPRLMEVARRDAVTAAMGLRAHFVSGAYAFRPGVSYTHPLDDPMAMAGYRIVQLDLPLIF